MKRRQSQRFRRLKVLFVVACFLLGGEALVRPAFAQDDWGVQRNPFSPTLVERYKKLLSQNPHDAGALGKLMGLYRRHRSLDILLREYREAYAKGGQVSNQLVIGYLHLHQGHQEEAIQAFTEAQKMGAKDIRVFFALGKLYRGTGRNDEAYTSYQDALKVASKKQDKMAALRALADVAMDRGAMADARRHLEHYLKLNPRDLATQLELGNSLVREKDFDGAVLVFRAAEKKLGADRPGRAEVIARIGDALAQKGDDAGAIKDYERGIRLVGRGHFLRKELTLRIVAIYRKRQESNVLLTKLEQDWQPKKRDPFEWTTMGRLYEETGQADKAIEAYTKAVHLAPYELDTQRRLIDLLEKSGHRKEARKRTEMAIRVAPNDARFPLELAERYWSDGEPQKALSLAKRIESRFKNNPSVIRSLANLYNDWNKPDKALTAYQHLLRLEPKDLSNIENLGEQYFQQGNKKKALQVWRKLSQANDAKSYARHARVLSEHDLLVESLELYDKAIRLEDKNAEFYKGRATVYAQLRQSRKAVQDWELVLALGANKKPNSVGNREARRQIIAILHRLAKAELTARIREWTQRFQKTPPDLGSGYFLADAYGRIGEHEKQRTTLEALASLQPGDIQLRFQLVSAYRKLGELDKAVSLLQGIAKGNPNRQQECFVQIAEIKTEQQNDEEAITYAQRALENSPTDPLAYKALAERYQAMQQHTKAIHAYEKVIELAPRTFSVYFTLARLYIDKRKAARLYRTVLSTATDPEILRRAGKEAIELEWLTGSLAELEEVVAPLVIAHGDKPIYRRILVQLYDRYVPQLVDELTSPENQPQRRQKAREELTRLGERGLRPLLEALADQGDVQQQRMAIGVLGYLGNRAAAFPLIRLVQKPAKKKTTSALIATLDWDVRVQALVAAGRLGDPRTIPDLANLAKHSEPTVRKAAVFGLAISQAPSSFAPLTEALDDPKVSVQVLACLGLANHPNPQSASQALNVIADEERHDLTRASCAWALSSTPSKATSAALVSLLQNGQSRSQQMAAWALGQQLDRQVLPELLEAYFTRSASVRDAAMQSICTLVRTKGELPTHPGLVAALSRRGLAHGGATQFDAADIVDSLIVSNCPNRALIGDLHGLDEEIAQIIHRSLQRHRDLVVRTLRDLDMGEDSLALGALSMHVDSLSPESLAAAKEVLDKVATHLSSSFIPLTQHRDPEIRRLSLNLMAKIGGQEALPYLKAGLGDPNRSVRISVLYSAALLAKVHGKEAEPLFVAVAKQLDAKSWQERVAAAQAIGRWPGAKGLDALVTALKSDSKSFVRSAAAQALGEKGVQRDSLYRALVRSANHRHEPTAAVRTASMTALHKLFKNKASRDIQTLRAQDPDPHIRANKSHSN